MNHTYLILEDEEEINTDSYQIRMILGNNITSFLKCRVQGMDGKFYLYYDITSKQALTELYEGKKLKEEDIRLIFGSFIQVMEQVTEYLLNPEHILLQPEYMYIDVEKKQMYFCYFPGKMGELKEQFKILIEYFLPMLDHEDGKAVMLGYGIYRRALEDTFHLENIKEELYGKRDEAEEKIYEKIDKKRKIQTDVPQENNKINETKNEEKIDLFEEENLLSREQKIVQAEDLPENKKSIWKIVIGIVGSILLFFGLMIANIKGFISIPDTEIILCIIVGMIGMAMTIFLMYERIKKMLNKPKNIADKENKMEVKSELDELFKDEELPVSKELESNSKEYGETVILCESNLGGTATLVSKEGQFATIYLEEEMTIIGKLETAADAVINLPTVSRVHAKIRKRDGEYFLLDLNSRNGTSVNGKLLKEEYMLKDQDEVDFAQARFIFLK